MSFDITTIRSQFPALNQEDPLIYLDSAATTQIPEVVLRSMQQFNETCRANVHRGMHASAEQATELYESARKTVQAFVKANRPEEIIFTKNTTESINLVAQSFGKILKKGDGVVLSTLEHHSNIVPWLQLQEERGIEVHWIDIKDGNTDMEQYKSLLERGSIKMVAVTGQSNVLGTKPPVKEMIAQAHDAGAKVLVDAAQLAAHDRIDVQDLDCDFLAFSGHKVYGPMGIGVLYGKRELLEKMPPFLGGGMMIHEVTRDGFSPADIPAKFEAGTPPITQAIGLDAALLWLSAFDQKEKMDHEQAVLHAAMNALKTIEGLSFAGPEDGISGCVSFVIDDIHPHDLTHILGQQGICLRAGHHCAQPLHNALGHNATTRLSVGIYNDLEEIESLGQAIEAAISTLQP